MTSENLVSEDQLKEARVATLLVFKKKKKHNLTFSLPSPKKLNCSLFI